MIQRLLSRVLGGAGGARRGGRARGTAGRGSTGARIGAAVERMLRGRR